LRRADGDSKTRNVPGPMKALFPRWSNLAIRLGLAVLLGGAAATIVGLMIYMRTPFGTGQFFWVDQPVEFDHRHHVIDDEIDCRYCHTTVETAPTAGYPSTEVCMGCHNQVWNQSAMLEPVRRSWFSGEPIPWNRVTKLPDHVYFDHSIHVSKGVGCVKCHGRVDEMGRVYQAMPLTMGFCLDCHRNPGPNLRPRDKVTDMTWRPEGDPAALARDLTAQYQVQSRTYCSACHR
jgi:hypothetical protein